MKHSTAYEQKTGTFLTIIAYSLILGAIAVAVEQIAPGTINATLASLGL